MANDSLGISSAPCGTMEASRRGVASTRDGSNPEIAYTIGGLRVSVPMQQSAASPSRRDLPCAPWEGRKYDYQSEARAILADRLIGNELPWIYVAPTCETKMCLQELHLRWYRAQKISYPIGVCVYCGMPAYTKDHLLPVTLTGRTIRKFVAVVPACRECNLGIGDRVGHRITERREEAHRAIRKKHRKVLEIGKRWTTSELAELGPNLRGHIERALAQREIVMQRLAWPWDSEYDKRAFEKSGFDDPIEMGLL